MTDDKLDLPRKTMRDMLFDTLWCIAYREHELTHGMQSLKAYRAMLDQAGFSDMPTDADALAYYNDHDEEDEDQKEYSSTKDVLLEKLCSKVWIINHHQNEMQKAAADLGAIKVVIARAGYDIDEDEVRRDVARRLSERFEF